MMWFSVKSFLSQSNLVLVLFLKKLQLRVLINCVVNIVSEIEFFDVELPIDQHMHKISSETLFRSIKYN